MHGPSDNVELYVHPGQSCSVFAGPCVGGEQAAHQNVACCPTGAVDGDGNCCKTGDSGEAMSAFLSADKP